MIDCEQIYALLWIRESDVRSVSLRIKIIDAAAQPQDVFQQGKRDADRIAGATARVDEDS